MKKVSYAVLALALSGFCDDRAKAADPFKPIGSKPVNQSFEANEPFTHVNITGDGYQFMFLPSVEYAQTEFSNFHSFDSNRTSITERSYKPKLDLQMTAGDLIADASVKGMFDRYGRSADDVNGLEAIFNGIYTIDGDKQLFPFYRFQRHHDYRFQTKNVNLNPKPAFPGLYADPNKRIRVDQHTFDLGYAQKWGRFIGQIGTFNDIYRFKTPTNFGSSLMGDADRADNALSIKLNFDAQGYNPFVTRLLPYVKYQIDRRHYKNRINHQGNKRSSVGHNFEAGVNIFGPTPLGTGFVNIGYGHRIRHYSSMGMRKEVKTPRFFAVASLDITSDLNVNAFADRIIAEPAPGFTPFAPFTNGFLAMPFSAGFDYSIMSEKTIHNQSKLSVKGQYTYIRYKNKFVPNNVNEGFLSALNPDFKQNVFEATLSYAHDYFTADAGFTRTLSNFVLEPRKSSNKVLFRVNVLL